MSELTHSRSCPCLNPVSDDACTCALQEREQIAGVIEIVIPAEYQVHVREGGAEENLVASLSVSVANLVRKLTAAEAWHTLAIRQSEELTAKDARFTQMETEHIEAYKEIAKWKEETLERLQDICDENGCPAGWNRLDFIRDYLRLQKKKLEDAEKHATDLGWQLEQQRNQLEEAPRDEQ